MNKQNKIKLTDREAKSIAPDSNERSEQRAYTLTVDCPSGYDVSCKFDDPSASGVILFEYGIDCQGIVSCCKGYAGPNCEPIESGSGSDSDPGSGSYPTNMYEACDKKSLLAECMWVEHGVEKHGRCMVDQTQQGRKLFCDTTYGHKEKL